MCRTTVPAATGAAPTTSVGPAEAVGPEPTPVLLPTVERGMAEHEVKIGIGPDADPLRPAGRVDRRRRDRPPWSEGPDVQVGVGCGARLRPAVLGPSDRITGVDADRLERGQGRRRLILGDLDPTELGVCGHDCFLDGLPGRRRLQGHRCHGHASIMRPPRPGGQATSGGGNAGGVRQLGRPASPQGSGRRIRSAIDAPHLVAVPSGRLTHSPLHTADSLSGDVRSIMDTHSFASLRSGRQRTQLRDDPGDVDRSPLAEHLEDRGSSTVSARVMRTHRLGGRLALRSRPTRRSVEAGR